MTGLASRFLMLGTFVLLTACAQETKQPAMVGPQPEPAKPAPPPTAAPATKAAPAAPRPAPATPPPARPAPPPPAVASQAPPAPAPSTPDAPKAEAPQVLTINVARANVREKPDTKAKILQVLSKGTKVTVVSKGDQWFRVRLTDGTEGWVAESVVTPGAN